MEITRNYKDIVVTYKEMAGALKDLGFENDSTKKVFAYKNKNFDAIVLLPLKDENAQVNQAHFSSISFLLSQKGLLENRDDLAIIIEKKRVGRQKATA